MRQKLCGRYYTWTWTGPWHNLNSNNMGLPKKLICIYSVDDNYNIYHRVIIVKLIKLLMTSRDLSWP